jgi:hypothetical protein
MNFWVWPGGSTSDHDPEGYRLIADFIEKRQQVENCFICYDLDQVSLAAREMK